MFIFERYTINLAKFCEGQSHILEKNRLVVHFRVTTSECISIEMKLEVVIDCRVVGSKQS